jgi:hypothetical protein
MNAWFKQLNRLVALRDSGELSEESFQEQKKRLWTLEQGVGEYNRQVGKEEKRFAADDIFQMRILELQIEGPEQGLADREENLLLRKQGLALAVEEALARSRTSSAVQEEYDGGEEELDAETLAKLLEETKALVAGLRDMILVLRSERLDAGFWTASNQIEEALYRNGSEAVSRWRQRVLEQKERLEELKR